MITAHAGCEKTAPNSIESVRKGISLGADAVEIDVRRREADGVLYLSHDPLLGGAVERCVKLSDAFKIVSGHPTIRINCDLKEGGLIPHVVDLAHRYGLGPERLIFTGIVYPSYIVREPGINRMADVYINAENIIAETYYEARGEKEGFSKELRLEFEKNPWAFVRKNILDESSSESENISEYVELISELCPSLYVKGLNIPYRILSDIVLEKFIRSGLLLSVWTVDEEKEVRRLLPYVENLTTRSVSVAKAVRKEAFSS